LPGWLRKYLGALVNGLLQALVAALGFVIFLIVFPIVLVLMLVEWIIGLLHQKSLYPERVDDPCPTLPESVTRRPDPCIYSQTLLYSQGLPFSYDNPDITIIDPADPSNVDFNLEPETEYLVNVRVHNASVDPAIGVRVGLGTAGAILNAPDYGPAERDPYGGELFRFVDVAGLSSSVTQFRWTSPPLQAEPNEIVVLISGVQARLQHPADSNRANNVGHRNITVVYGNPGHVEPGQAFVFSMLVANPLRRPARLSFETNAYEVDSHERVALHPRFARGWARWSLAARLYNIRPTLYARPRRHLDRSARNWSFGRLSMLRRSRLQVVKVRYEDFDPVREALRSRDWSLPPGFEAGPTNPEELELAPGEQRRVPFSVRIPNDATPGSELTVNFVCRNDTGDLLGGFAVPLRISGEVE
jgi:hypothetical protein